VLGSKGACIAPTHLQHVPSKFSVFFCNKFLKLIDAFPPQTKIVAYIKTESKTFLCFHEDYGTFCEGERVVISRPSATNAIKDDNEVITKQQLNLPPDSAIEPSLALLASTNESAMLTASSVLSIKSAVLALMAASATDGLGHNGLVNYAVLDSLVNSVGHSDIIGFSHNGLIDLNGLDLIGPIGRTGSNGFIGVIGHIDQISLISLGDLAIKRLVSLSALSVCQLIGLISLVCLNSRFSILGCISCKDLVDHNGLVGCNDLADHIGLNLIDHNGLIGFIGLGVSFIGLGFVSLIGYISLIGHIGLIGLVGRIGNNSLVGVTGLSLISLVSIVGLIGFGLVSLIGLGDLSITSLFGSSASLACYLISLFILVGLSIHWPFKQAAHGVSIMQSSATKIINAAIYYYCAVSLIHVHSTMCWWLALARKKLWWWIASFGKSYNGDVLQYAKQLFSLELPQMTKYCVMRECDNIHSWISTTGDLAFSHQQEFTVLNSQKGFLEITSRDLTLFTLFSLLLN
jgi:hypothetical protein